jgi:hypothetical protein
MVGKELNMYRDLVSQFIQKYPTVRGYTLICVCEEIVRRIAKHTGEGIGVNGVLEKALADTAAADYLVRVCVRFQNQEK